MLLDPNVPLALCTCMNILCVSNQLTGLFYGTILTCQKRKITGVLKINDGWVPFSGSSFRVLVLCMLTSVLFLLCQVKMSAHYCHLVTAIILSHHL